MKPTQEINDAIIPTESKPSNIKSLYKKWGHLLLFLYLPIHMVLFLQLESAITTDYWVVYSPLDNLIPFVEAFIIPYVLWYPYMLGLGVYLAIQDVPIFKRYMWFIIIGFVSSMLFCLIIPNGQDLRPTAFASENVFTDIVKSLYAADTNTNVFPSMHVIGAMAVTYTVFKCPKLNNIYIKISSIVLTALICASTVFLKQHSILDIFGGLIASQLIFMLVFRKPKKKRATLSS
jgi:membrane-associated phospholipid phosphatase